MPLRSECQNILLPVCEPNKHFACNVHFDRLSTVPLPSPNRPKNIPNCIA